MIEDLKQVRDALEALLNYQQADIDGVMVLTSRQAIHEVSDYVRATLDRIIADHIPDASKMVVPYGYALVPIEPTRDMIDAFMGGESGSYIVDSYKAMLSAAPQPPTRGD